MKSSISYLATPYFHDDPRVRKLRYEIVTEVTADFLKKGVFVFSPVTHNIPMKKWGLHGNWETWKRFDLAMLEKCERLFVLKLPGWEESKGVQGEIAFAKDRHIPIEEIQVSKKKIEQARRKIEEDPFEDLSFEMNKTFQEREWDCFHSPKNLAMNIMIEAAEIGEFFRWLDEQKSYHIPPEKLKELEHEIGDVLINLILLAEKFSIKPIEAAYQKLNSIKQKYPSEKLVVYEI